MPAKSKSPKRGNAFGRLVSIGTAALIAFQFHYMLSQTRRMSASLFQDTSRFDAFVGGSSGASATPFIGQQTPHLPKWLADYFDWHIAMRKKYPGNKILTDPDAPGVLIKACAHKCGGLHDRLGGLGWDLYLANQTRRVVLMHWCIPAPIEEFLQPNAVDWTLPKWEMWDERLFSNLTQTHFHCSRAVEEWKGLFDGYVEYMQGDEFFERNVDLALDRAVNGEYRHHKVLRYKVLGVDRRLQQRLLLRHNEKDQIAWTDSFPAMFWTLFKPSEGLQKELDKAFLELGVSAPRDRNAPPFYAIHARIRHPRGHAGQDLVSKIGEKGGPDKFGMAWDGEQKQFAINVAEHALECAQKRHLDRHAFYPSHYVFYADSEDLVTYMGHEHNADGVHVRNMTGVEALHVDRQQGYPPPSYYPAFVDLFVAAQAS